MMLVVSTTIVEELDEQGVDWFQQGFSLEKTVEILHNHPKIEDMEGDLRRIRVRSGRLRV